MEKIKEFIIITFGFVLVSIGIEYFYVPSNITGGGITGLAMIINHYRPALPIGMLMIIMNVILFIIGFVIIGGNFGIKTIYASFGLSGAVWFIETTLKPQPLTSDIMLSAIIGTIFLGTGLGIVFSQNASTGGTDIIAKILNKFFHIDMGKSMQMVDLFVIIAAAVTFGIAKGLYALVCVLLNGMIIDRVIEGFNSVKVVMVFSNNSEGIKDYIIKNIDRGCTIFKGTGGYTGNENSIVYSVMDRTQLIKLRMYIKMHYSNAFIIVEEAREVLGQGFQNM